MSGRYDGTEFNSIRYLSNSSGGLGSCPDGLARISYYGASAFPTLVWQGTNVLVGAGTDVIDGGPYDAIVQSMLPDATPWVVEITDFDLGVSPYVTTRIALEDDVADITGHVVHVCLIENDCLYSGDYEQDVLRDIVDDIAITIDGNGQEQTHTANFTLDPSWNTANMRIIAFLQRDSDKVILQSCNSVPTGPYAFRYYSLGERVVVDSGSHQFDEFALFNMGDSSDTYDLALDTSGMPGDWNAYFTDGVNNYTSLPVNLAAGARASFNVVVETGSSGGGAVALTIHSQGDGTDRQVKYSVITADTEILLVDDDGAESFESDYYGPALDTTGRSYAIWDRGSAALSAGILSNFSVVVWDVGFAFPTLDDADRAALGAYLDGGGALFISGQDVGWDSNDQGGAALVWYHDYLHANFVADDTNDYTIDGERVYVIGHSMGGGVAAALAVARPNAITAACCIAGSGSFSGATSLPPVRVIGAELDGISNADRMRTSADRAAKDGLPVTFELAEHYGHTLVVGAMLEDAIDWLLAQRRESK